MKKNKNKINTLAKRKYYYKINFLFIILISIIIAISIALGLSFIFSIENNEKPIRYKFNDNNDTIYLFSNSEIHNFHKVSKERIDLEILKCGIGWKQFDNVSCTRDILWPSVVDSNMQSLSISPCDDFYQYSCGDYIKDPLNYQKDATFDYIQQLSDRTMQNIAMTIVQNIPVPENQFSAFYHSCLHFNRSKAQIVSPEIETLLSLIELSIKDYKDLYFVWGSLQLFQTILPIELSFEINPLNATELYPFIRQSGIFTYPHLIESSTHLTEMKDRLSYISNQPLQWAKEIINIEKRLVDAWKDSPALTLVDYIPQFSHDLITDWSLLDDTRYHINFTDFLLGACPQRNNSIAWLNALKARPLWVHSRYYMDALPDILQSFSLASWIHYTKHAVLFHIFNGQSPFTDFAFVKAFDVRYTLPWDRPYFFPENPHESQTLSTEDKCLALSRIYLTNLLDNYYVFQHLPQALKESAHQFALNIQSEYVNQLQTSQFSFLAEKISNVHFQIAVPDNWPFDRSTLVINPNIYSENILSVRKYHAVRSFNFYLEHILKNIPFEYSKLLDLPITGGDAFYSHQLGLVVLNAGMINLPIYSTLFDETSLYSRYGFLIAHELSHSIDNIGILFDAQGSYAPWLPTNISENYNSIMHCLKDYYNSPNGKTTNEDFADHLALSVSFNSFQKNNSPSIEEQQKFFTSLAQMFCSNLDDNSIYHSKPSIRINNLISQFLPFKKVFNCPNSSKLSCNLTLF